MTPSESFSRRDRMVTDQLEARGIRDRKVLAAMRKVQREFFVDEAMRERAYDDAPLPIGSGQTISQPYMVARMCELAHLEGHERVLEIGAGSGYQTAILAELAGALYAVEVRPELGAVARRRLSQLGCRNVEIGVFDGKGAPKTFASEVTVADLNQDGVPELVFGTYSLQANGGRLIVPVGPRQGQRLAIVTRRGEEFDTEWTTPCTFVDLIGKYGWGGEGPARA